VAATIAQSGVRRAVTSAAMEPHRNAVAGVSEFEVEDSDLLPGRDAYIDFVRACSLLVVVIWHWVFTILVWKPDGPRATSPLGFFDGLWVVTWLFQVMPLFFFVGGYSHMAAWHAASAKGTTIWTFVARRVTSLAIPALALAGVWVALGVTVIAVFDVKWMARAVILVISPLWFLAVYLLLVLLLPVALWLHRRFDVVVLVWLAGLAAVVDLLRFDRGIEWVAWFNMILVWGICHQLGFFYARIVRGGSTAAAALGWGGLFGLVVLVGTGFYPGSMVGVPGDKFSNMAPPTLPILALVVFQAGVALALRPVVLPRLEAGGGWTTFSRVINRFAMPLYLFHSTGMAVSRGLWHWIRGGQEQREPDLVWWLTRPFAFIGALVLTLPVIFLFGRRWVKPHTTDTAPSAT
jgi:peptidoglycan/LPS O-acetylase OafA/YrhL